MTRHGLCCGGAVVDTESSGDWGHSEVAWDHHVHESRFEIVGQFSNIINLVFQVLNFGAGGVVEKSVVGNSGTAGDVFIKMVSIRVGREFDDFGILRECGGLLKHGSEDGYIVKMS